MTVTDDEKPERSHWLDLDLIWIGAVACERDPVAGTTAAAGSRLGFCQSFLLSLGLGDGPDALWNHGHKAFSERFHTCGRQADRMAKTGTGFGADGDSA